MGRTEQLADTLEEYSTYLELDGQEGRAHAYDRAARAIRNRGYIPPNPADIDGVGEAVRDTITEYQTSGEISDLQSLKEDHHYYENLKNIDGVGPTRARQMHDRLRIDTVSDVILVGDDLTLLPRVGERRAENIVKSAKNIDS